MTCQDCGATLGKANGSGYCRKHWSKHKTYADHGEKIKDALRRKIAHDPAYLESCRDRARKMLGPKQREAAREASKRSGAWRVAAAAITPEHRAKGAKRLSEQRLAWCPRELREEYRRLVYTKKVKAAEAREIILAQHEKNMAAFRRKLKAA